MNIEMIVVIFLQFHLLSAYILYFIAHSCRFSLAPTSIRDCFLYYFQFIFCNAYACL